MKTEEKAEEETPHNEGGGHCRPSTELDRTHGMLGPQPRASSFA
jgi:hypothetical protein